MKLSEMKEIKASRENLTGFLHYSDIARINLTFGNLANVDKMSFDDICDKTVELYQSKEITNKKASIVFNILAVENVRWRAESHRRDNCGAIFQYDAQSHSYIFLKKGSDRDFNALNRYL